MKLNSLHLKPQLHFSNNAKPMQTTTTTTLHTKPSLVKLKSTANTITSLTSTKLSSCYSFAPKKTEQTSVVSAESGDGMVPRWLIFAGVSVGVALVVLGHQEALALGPEGPLVEEFWDNVRRYGLYVLTVSTGAIYTLLQPIVELLKNPISAVLIIIVLVGSLYVVSQIVSAMVGVSDFAYQYAY